MSDQAPNGGSSRKSSTTKIKALRASLFGNNATLVPPPPPEAIRHTSSFRGLPMSDACPAPRKQALAAATRNCDGDDDEEVDSATLRSTGESESDATLEERVEHTENLSCASERAYLAGNHALQRELDARPKDMAAVSKLVEQKQKEQMAGLAAVFRESQRVSLCFLLDTTGSMRDHIAGVKAMIMDLVGLVAEAGCQLKYLAFVGYKDWNESDKRTTPGSHFEILRFTESVEQFQAFVAGIEVTGGDDTPEDVLGGLRVVNGLTWPQDSGCRMLFHIADAPPHGAVYNALGHGDNFPKGHPADPKLADVV